MSILGFRARFTNAKQVEDGMAALEVRSRSRLSDAVAKCGIEAGNILKRLMTGQKRKDPFWGVMGATTLDSLAVRSGHTRASVVATGRVYLSGNTLSTFVGTPAEHMKTLEDGGTVRPTSGKFLRIPTAAMQTPSGVDRLMGRSARTIAGAFIYPTKAQVASDKFRGNKGLRWLAIGGRDGRLTLLYLLKESVTIKAHHLFRTMNQRVQPVVARLLGEASTSLTKGA